uniref:Uncharacterized protein n=1 Tax=Fervidicoccus fontis TaxID=683846 RepID=A0A7J3SNH8_9CREN
MEKAIETRIKPPEDRVTRICHRMTQCEPLAYINNGGPDFEKIMRGHHHTTLKLVLTGADYRNQEALRQWANDENQKHGGTNTYQIFPHDESLRDDILHLTCGWPLWLFDEIRKGEALMEDTRENDPNRYHNSFLLRKQIPPSRDHQISPLSESDAQTWFGIGLALRDIDFGAHEIKFNPERFPGLSPIEAGNLEGRLERAYQLFRQQGLAHIYKIYIRREQERDMAAFKRRLEEGLANRQEALRKAYEAEQITDNEQTKLADFYKHAKIYADGIVIL